MKIISVISACGLVEHDCLIGILERCCLILDRELQGITGPALTWCVLLRASSDVVCSAEGQLWRGVFCWGPALTWCVLIYTASSDVVCSAEGQLWRGVFCWGPALTWCVLLRASSDVVCSARPALTWCVLLIYTASSDVVCSARPALTWCVLLFCTASSDVVCSAVLHGQLWRGVFCWSTRPARIHVGHCVLWFLLIFQISFWSNRWPFGTLVFPRRQIKACRPLL